MSSSLAAVYYAVDRHKTPYLNSSKGVACVNSSKHPFDEVRFFSPEAFVRKRRIKTENFAMETESFQQRKEALDDLRKNTPQLYEKFSS